MWTLPSLALRSGCFLAIWSSLICTFTVTAAQTAGSQWPAIHRDARPHTFWWWMGSAVDRTNITRELATFKEAGVGGVHIIPIYGAKGYESRYINYLSPEWMDMLNYTVSEANRLDLDVDMTTGTGWCFGGPQISPQEACSALVWRTIDIPEGRPLQQKIEPSATLIAYGPDDKVLDITRHVSDGSINWKPDSGAWRVYVLSQKPTIKVKRSAPGGAGWMLNMFYPPAMDSFLDTFEKTFSSYKGLRPRSMYHDSYEYNGVWSPDILDRFEKRRGYSLKNELPALLAEKSDADHDARVRCDFRQTLSEIMAEETLPKWAQWCAKNNMLTRDQAHGSPGNLLDLYGVADIPETEMFSRDRSKLVSKFASSAGHVMGRKFVSSETGTWLKEHFTERLCDMKQLADELFLSGVNHVFYHGACYSPAEAQWPGWVFYASYEMNSRNSVWRDVPALNNYIARCQSILQAGRPDNDVLLYWPIHEFWRTPGALEQKLTVHHRDWLEKQPIGKTAAALWENGIAFDFTSDHQLANTTCDNAKLVTEGGQRYSIVVVPPAKFIPLPTVKKLVSLAQAGATVIFEERIPEDVPGLANLENQRAEFASLTKSSGLDQLAAATAPAELQAGKGRIAKGHLIESLTSCGIQPETIVRDAKLSLIRRADDHGYYYFVVNETTKAFAGWVVPGRPAKSVTILDPYTGAEGQGTSRPLAQGYLQVYLQLDPGASIILRTGNSSPASSDAAPVFAWHKQGTDAQEIKGQWDISFIEGGPVLPTALKTARLASWTELGGDEAKRFAGTARYHITFDAPKTDTAKNGGWFLDLGNVAQSARVTLNGTRFGTLICPPYRLYIPELKQTGNILEVEVTNVSANRIRDLDIRKVPWKYFTDINVVNIDYKPFDASGWPLTDSGLLGPVTLAPAHPPL